MIPAEDTCEVQDLGTERNFFTLIPNIILHYKLDPWAFKAYFVIKMTAGDKGRCFKTNSTMSEEIGCSIPTFIKLKKELQEHGLIDIVKRKHPNGGDMPDLIQIVDIWGQNMEYMLKLYPKNPENDHFMFDKGGKRGLQGGVNAVNGGGKPNLGGGVNAVNPNKKQKEQEQKEQQQQQAAAAASYKELEDVDIPIADKIEISKTYTLEEVKHALLWLKHNTRPLKRGIAAALKWACKNKPTIEQPPKEKEKEKTPVNFASFNRSYFREVSRVSHQNGFLLHCYGLIEAGEYLQTDNSKIYFKDVSFLEQVANFIRKKAIECKNIFDMIEACKKDLATQ